MCGTKAYGRERREDVQGALLPNHGSINEGQKTLRRGGRRSECSYHRPPSKTLQTYTETKHKLKIGMKEVKAQV